jgi:hypothetical protein
MSENRLRVKLYGLSLELFFADKEIKNRIEQYFHPFLENSLFPDHIFEIGKDSIKIDGILANGLRRGFPFLLEEIIFYINTTFWKEAKGHLIIHSGAVKKGEKILLFPGFSGSGKSTLVSWFFINGWDYLSDDLICVGLNDKRIYPYPIPLRLKNPPAKIPELLEKIPEIKMECFSCQDENLYYIHIEKNHKKTSFRPESLYTFIFPNYSPREKLSLTRRNAKETFTRLLSHCINFSSCQSEAFDRIFELTEKVTGYDLVFGGFEQIEDALINKGDVNWPGLIS